MSAKVINKEKFERTYQGFCSNHSIEETRDILQAWIEQLNYNSTSAEQSRLFSTQSPEQPVSPSEEPAESNLPLRSISHLKKQLEEHLTLKPLKYFIYTEPFPSKHTELSNLHGLENGLPPTSSGFFLVDTGIGLIDAPRHPLSQGTIQQQTFERKAHGIIVCDSNDNQIIHTKREFSIPRLALHSNHSDDLESVYESHLKRLENSHEKHEYLIATSHSSRLRTNLGLPAESLHPGNRLLCTSRHFPGIHSSYVYISSASGTAFALHVEDFHLNSANILYEGAPKLWIIIDPNSKLRLESRLAETLNITPVCSQFVRHQFILPQPSLLRQWKIRFQILLQPPGSMILLQPNTYHCGLNLGFNIAEAINYSDSEWTCPPLYLECRRGKPCHQDSPMSIKDMEIKKFRPLEIDTSWEDPPSPQASTAKIQSQTQRSNRTSTTYIQGLVTRSRPRKTGKPKKMITPQKRIKSAPITTRSRRECLPNTESSSCSDSSRTEPPPHSNLLHNETSPNSSPSHFTPSSSSISGINTPRITIGAASVLEEHEHNPLSMKGAGYSPRFSPESNSLWNHFDEPHELPEITKDLPNSRESDSDDTQSTTSTSSMQALKHLPTQQSDMSQDPDSHRINCLFQQNDKLTRKRPCESSDGQAKTKMFRPVFTEVRFHRYNDRSERLQSLGQEWEAFYNEQIQASHLSSDELYQILALVSAIACPQVLLDLADLYRSISDQPSEMTQMNHVAKAYWLYNNTEAHIMCGRVRKRLLSVFMYKQFKTIRDEWQDKLDKRRRTKRRKNYDRFTDTLPTDKTIKPATLALDTLVQCCHPNSTSFKEEQLHSERQKIQKLKDKGAKFFTFNQHLKTECENLELWYLLPIREIKSPLDKHKMIHYQQYLDLEAERLEIFTKSISRLRPKLGAYSLPTGEHDWLAFGSHDHRRLKLKIENMDPDILAEESLDSKLLLTCFELQDNNNNMR